MLKEPTAAAGGSEPAPRHCAGCRGRIVDRYYLLAVEQPWHSACLKCYECKMPLDGDLTCFTRDGNIYCKEDYYRLFSLKRCERCHGGISASELVMRARDYVYHIHCFTCVTCNMPLSKGDQFGMRDGFIYCRHHYELLLSGEYGGQVPEFVQFSPTEQIPYIPPVTVGQKGRPRKRKVQHEDMTSLGMGPGLHEYPSDLDHMGYESPGPHSQRSKRMRTSFKHHQLRTMKSYFALNQNPDAKDLKQLAQKTGLSKRVLQVWFQNARAKWRRTVLRQEKSGDSKDGLQPLHTDASAAGRPLSEAAMDTPGSSMAYADMYA